MTTFRLSLLVAWALPPFRFFVFCLLLLTRPWPLVQGYSNIQKEVNRNELNYSQSGRSIPCKFKHFYSKINFQNSMTV